MLNLYIWIVNIVTFASLRENVSYKNEKDYAILVRLADYTNGFDTSKFVYVDKHAYDFLSKSKLYGGEIIMSNVGSIGKSFICPDLGMPMSLAPNSILIRTGNNRFYYYLLTSPHYQGKIKSISSQTALPKFNKTEFKKIHITIPCTLAEQEHIVAELDLLSDIIEKKKAQLKELDNLAQSIFYDMFGDPIANEKGWPTMPMNEVAPQKQHEGVVPSKNGEFWLLNLDMVAQQTGDIISHCYFSKSDIGNSVVIFNENNVLYSKLRPYLNKVVIPDGVGYATSELVPLCPQKDSLDRYFLAGLLRSPQFVSQINSKVEGAKMPRVSMPVFRKFPVILPPLNLQQSYASKIKFIKKQKEIIQKSIEEAQALFDSRMDFYFN